MICGHKFVLILFFFPVSGTLTSSFTNTGAMDPVIPAFLAWREQFPFDRFMPVDHEKLALMPKCVLHWTKGVEARLGKEINPEQGFWIMQHWLENPAPRAAVARETSGKFLLFAASTGSKKGVKVRC